MKGTTRSARRRVCARARQLVLLREVDRRQAPSAAACRSLREWTDPENLTAVCWFQHHVVIHGQGFGIDSGSPPQRRRLL
ncbi:MAG: hypothetical protein WBN35_04530, partial [Acidimicrobiia bacterium]